MVPMRAGNWRLFGRSVCPRRQESTTETEHDVSEQAQRELTWAEENLATIGSRTEVDDDGRPEVHDAGYYLAKIDQDTTAVKLQVATLSQQVAALTQAPGHQPDAADARPDAAPKTAGIAGLYQRGLESARKSAKTFARDLFERVLSTFVQSFIGGVVITQPFNRSMWYAALVGAVGAALSLAKGLIARKVGVINSASLSPHV